MNINKMTEKLQQGLVNAQSLATSLHHQEIDTPHLLTSLLQDHDGLAARVFTKAGYPIQEILQELKQILVAEGINLSELARALGFANDQRLHSALRAEDVKSGLIESIAKVTNKSVCFFYQNRFGVLEEGNSKSTQESDKSITKISEKFISLLEKKDEQMDRLISLLEESRTKH